MLDGDWSSDVCSSDLLADAPPDPELRALLRLGEAAAADGVGIAVALSAMTTPRVRALFAAQPATAFRTMSGLRFTVDGGDIFGATVAAGYMPESADFEAFMQLVNPGGVVVDVGANFGLYALSAALYTRPHGRVFAFEPAPPAFAMLERNIADNNLNAVVTARRAAVGASAGHAQFYVGRDVSFSSLHRTTRVDDSATEVSVEVVTLDLALADVRSIDLLKIDVEGGEGAVLSGAHNLLRRSRAPIVQFEFSHKNMDDARRASLGEALALLARDGIRIYRRGATGPVGLLAPTEAFSGNLILARDGEGADHLLRALQRTDRLVAKTRDLGALALLKRIAEQNEMLQRAELLQREAIQVADSIVGEGVAGGGSEAVRAMQQAWLDVRKRAREAEAQARGVEARTGRLVEERDQLLEKISGLRESIDHLHHLLEKGRASAAAIQERNAEKSTSWRQMDAKLRERVSTLESALKESQEKFAASRAEYDQLMRRLKASESKREYLIGVTKRLQARCEALLVQLGERGETEASPIGEETSN
jgi:FkbM family methyltransferase